MAAPLAIDACLAILAATPDRLAERTASLPSAVVDAARAPGEWSVNEILAHLRACQDTWGPWIRRIVTEDTPGWRDVSARATLRRGDYGRWAFADALASFTSQRAELLALLRGLDPDAWQRTALVRRASGVEARSVAHYADRMARHEADHLRQIEALLDRDPPARD